MDELVGLDVPLFASDDHPGAPAHDHVDLLGSVAMATLARFAGDLDPGGGEGGLRNVALLEQYDASAFRPHSRASALPITTI